MASNKKKRKVEGSGKFCVVVGCTNSSMKLAKWKHKTCDIHTPQVHNDCPCIQPYQMHRFPRRSNDYSEANRRQWVKNINRKNFLPRKYSCVCSIHFEDGRPTINHPYPTLAMGYQPCEKLSAGRPVPRRRINLTPVVAVEDKAEQGSNIELDSSEEVFETQHSIHSRDMSTQNNMQSTDASTQWYDFSIADHNYAKPATTTNRPTQTQKIQTEIISEVSVGALQDTTIKFYTGLSMPMFWALVRSLMAPIATTPPFRLTISDQILLVLMRLRLGLMFTDLGIRFKVSKTTACEIFAFWITHMAKFMRDNIIFWLPRDTLARIRPKSFTSCHPKATCIIDFTEIYIQRPKNLKKRAQTYSNYKSHNTYKALYCIAPNGFVMYVSKLFGGRASDVFISHNSGFGSHLLPGDEVLADRGFTIENILPVGVKLSIPAFTKGNKDRCLPEENVASTRRIANVRIHVERAIRRLKCFKILANVIPCRIKNVDDILIVCAGLCNLQPCLINDEVCTAADDIAGSELRDDDNSDLDNLACMYDSEA